MRPVTWRTTDHLYFLSMSALGTQLYTNRERWFNEYENPNIISHYFAAEKSIVSRREVSINAPYYPNSSVTRTPYDTYAISYCLAHSSEEFSLFYMPGTSGVIHEVTLVETFVKGLEDHCSQSSMPRVRNVRMCLLYLSAKGSSIVLYWFKKAKFSPEIKEIYLEFHDNTSDDEEEFLKSIVKLQSLEIHIDSLRWIGALNNLTELRVLRVFTSKECNLPPPEVCNWSEEYGLIGGNKLTEVVFDIKFHCNSLYKINSSTDVLIKSVLKSVLISTQITKVVLSNISRETMVGVRSILLHCPSLTTLELKRTRLGYDGILYICSPLSKNAKLTRLFIHDDEIPHKGGERRQIDFSAFTTMERVPLASKTTCTECLLELNNILKDNNTLEEIRIQSGLFSAEYRQWTGLGPFQQFNVGAVRSGMSPNLRRSFSSSDLTQPQTLLCWDRQFKGLFFFDEQVKTAADFKKLFSQRKQQGKKLFSLTSFTAPDTAVLQSFSGLDPRLKKCLSLERLRVKS